MNEQKIKAMANALWDDIIRYGATQESVTEAIRTAYREGMEQAQRDAAKEKP